VILLKDAADKLITSIKPSIAMGGGQTDLKDPVLVGNEWIAEVSSKEPGDRSAAVKAGDVDIATVGMTFVAVTSAVPAAKTASPLPVSSIPVRTPVDYKVIVGAGIVLFAILATIGWRFRLFFFAKHFAKLAANSKV